MSNSFSCQYNPGVVISNSCPIDQCWANFEEITGNCIFQYLKRNEITIYDLAIIQNHPKEQVEHQLENERKIVAGYWKLLQELEQPAPTTVCSQCGILRETAGVCLHQVNCFKRRSLYRNQCKSPPLNQFNLKLTPAHFYAIFTKPEFEQLLGPYCQDRVTLHKARDQQLVVRGIYPIDQSEESDV